MTDPANGLNESQPDKQEIAARKRVGPPARLLLFLSVLNLVGVVFGMVQTIVLKQEGPDAHFREGWEDLKKKPGNQEILSGWTAESSLIVVANTMLGYLGISGLISVLTLAGARRMSELRSYGLAVASTVLMAVPCTTPCFVLGQIAGVWGFVILMQPDVRKAFQ